MKTLALEFASPRRSVAVAEAVDARPTRVLAEVADESPGKRGPLAMVAEALAKARVDRREIECIVVGLGPGSYTGIRMAIALAQGWQLAHGVRLLGVGSADAVARRLWVDGERGLACVVIDAQRNEFYLGGYKIEDAGATLIEALRIVPRAEVEGVIASGGLVAMPEEPRAIKGAKTVFASAADVAWLATGRNDFVSGEKLEPVYLRAVSFAKAPPPRDMPFQQAAD